MSKRSKACDISPKVRQVVAERDGGLCIICKHFNRTKEGFPNMHYLSRAHSGLGIEQNIVSGCMECHRLYDGVKREEYKEIIRDYLKSHYADWNEEDLIYDKWRLIYE